MGAGKALLGALLLCGCAMAHGADCDEHYFAPADTRNAVPLRHPHPDFARKLRMAEEGTAADQRTLAVAYDAGLLVSPCADKAFYWYERAARGGDEVAARWLARHERFAHLADNPECIGDYCETGGNVRNAFLQAGPNGHFFAPVTINGVTLLGMVDTGASTVAMSYADALKFRVDSLPGKDGLALTANGVRAQKVVVLPLVKVAGIELHDVRASIGITGPMLIGMSFLSRLNLQMGEGRLSLGK